MKRCSTGTCGGRSLSLRWARVQPLAVMVVALSIPTSASGQRVDSQLIGVKPAPRLFMLPGGDSPVSTLRISTRSLFEMTDTPATIPPAPYQSRRGPVNGWTVVGVGLMTASATVLIGAIITGLQNAFAPPEDRASLLPWLGAGVALGATTVIVTCTTRGCYWRKWWRDTE